MPALDPSTFSTGPNEPFPFTGSVRVLLPLGSLGGASCCGCTGARQSMIYIYSKDAPGQISDAYACNGCDCNQVGTGTPFQFPSGETMAISVNAGKYLPEDSCACKCNDKLFEVSATAGSLSLTGAWADGQSTGFLTSKARDISAQNSSLSSQVTALSSALNTKDAVIAQRDGQLAELRAALDQERAALASLQAKCGLSDVRGISVDSGVCDPQNLAMLILAGQ